jgi:hypothetical protein
MKSRSFAEFILGEAEGLRMTSKTLRQYSVILGAGKNLVSRSDYQRLLRRF